MKGDPDDYLPSAEEINAAFNGDTVRQKLSIRTPNELINMTFDESDILLGDRLLARGQPMTILAPGGTGKSRILLQMLACLITDRDFVGFPCRGRGMKWLLLQTENSNRRLQSDLHRIKAWLGNDWAEFDAALKIHTMEHEEDGMVYLSDVSNQKAIEELIVEHACTGVAFDPLGDFSMGDPNKDQDMRDTCRCISKLCKKNNPDRAVIVVHHAGTGKAGASKATGYDRTSFGRNSKVLHSWTRGQINIAAGSSDSNEKLVIACGKCSNGKEFDAFGVVLNLDTMIYEVDPEFNLEEWQQQVSGEKSNGHITPERVREMCPVPGASKSDLSKILIKEFGFSRATAYRHIDSSEKAKQIKRSRTDENYFRG